MKKLQGKTALVTGSSQGIGAGCALRLAADGANVVLNGHKQDERADKLIADIEAAGGQAHFVEADVSSVAAVQALIEKAVSEFGDLHILVNNAGVEIHSPFTEVTEEDYDKVMNINLKGVFFGTQAFARHCKARGHGGVVINMSSVHEETAFPNFAAYCASKGGLRMLCRNLATELAPLGIRIVNVAPGAIHTKINTELEGNPDLMKRLLQNIPLARMGKVEEVAALVSFLASDDASYITGSTHLVDGGMAFHYEER